VISYGVMILSTLTLRLNAQGTIGGSVLVSHVEVTLVAGARGASKFVIFMLGKLVPMEIDAKAPAY
jgi:hypothetical protein